VEKPGILLVQPLWDRWSHSILTPPLRGTATTRDSVAVTHAGFSVAPPPIKPATPTSRPVLPAAVPVAPTPGPVLPTGVPSDAPVSSRSGSACPLITLDFRNLENPMARYYGQGSTLQGGDYLFDQLWWTHGVRVSARIRESYFNDDDDIYIPNYLRGVGWVDSKLSHKVNDYRTGGAVRLFDSARPSKKYGQSLSTVDGDGDSDLGAPNDGCGGPGKNIRFFGLSCLLCPHGRLCVLILHIHLLTHRPRLRRKTREQLPELQLARPSSIIQDGDRSCPDDAFDGGIMTFDFREPIEFIKTISFLNIERSDTPDITIFYEGTKTTVIDAPFTDKNGFVSIPFKTSLYKLVSRIEVKIFNSGVVTSLEYPYCAKTPTTAISVKKYAGPSNLCSQSGIPSMQDVFYDIPKNTQWAYCYQISIPSNSEECLYDITLSDSASVGGIGSFLVTKTSEMLCPGEVRYIAGLTRSSSQVTVESTEAAVQGYGYYSGTLVSGRDSAMVRSRLNNK